MFWSKIIIRLINLSIRQATRNPDYSNIGYFRRALEKLAGRDVLPLRGITFRPETINDLEAEWIIPRGAPKNRVVLYFHGGGYATGSITTHRKWVGYLAQKTGIQYLLFNYRLAPEHTFPAPLDDALSIWNHLLQNGYKPEHIGFAGDSAGGGLATATLLLLRDRNLPLPACAYLCCPWLDMTGRNPSWKENRTYDHMVPYDGLVVWAKNYLKDTDVGHPYASPVFAELDGLPPLHIQVGERESLRDDSLIFSDKARRAGVSVDLYVGEGMTHCWQSFWRFLPAGRTANHQAGQFLRQKLQP